MDDVNISQNPPATATHNESPDRESAGKLQTFTQACAAMKTEIATEAQQIVIGTEKMGKHPTFTEACSVMKNQMADEAQQLLGVESASQSLMGEAVGSTGDEVTAQSPQLLPVEITTPKIVSQEQRLISTAAAGDFHDLETQQIAQAKQALKEANWFEQST
jgi:hypothetical protein